VKEKNQKELNQTKTRKTLKEKEPKGTKSNKDKRKGETTHRTTRNYRKLTHSISC
jgi:hypothetical protein